MKYRKLRIAFSAVCGIICLLLMVLWLRSYSRFESLILPGDNSVTVLMGRAYVNERFQLSDNVVARLPRRSGMAIPQADGTAIPLWSAVLVAAILIVCPWLRWRFSLRTLLIAITLVAAGLGLIVWAAK
jgi:hypothetical protein